MTTTTPLLEELDVGVHRVFLDAGFTEVGRPTARSCASSCD